MVCGHVWVCDLELLGLIMLSFRGLFPFGSSQPFHAVASKADGFFSL